MGRTVALWCLQMTQQRYLVMFQRPTCLLLYQQPCRKRILLLILLGCYTLRVKYQPHLWSLLTFQCLFTGLDYWTGLLHWTTGLDYWTHPKWCKIPFPAFFSIGEKLIMYIQPTSLLNSCKFAPLTCWGNFRGVSRGQTSHAYLISFNNELQLLSHADGIKLLFPLSMLQNKD